MPAVLRSSPKADDVSSSAESRKRSHTGGSDVSDISVSEKIDFQASFNAGAYAWMLFWKQSNNIKPMHKKTE